MHTIFYSWQSDLPSKYNRNFIENAIKTALKNLNKSDDYIFELNLDRDTKGEPGTPDIVDTIFKKIANSGIFIADISPVGKSLEGKLIPNPNVLLELGYAAGVLGWDNIICVCNTVFGEVTDLPFDLRHRRPILYTYNEATEKNKNQLIDSFEAAFKLATPEAAEERRLIKRAFVSETAKAIKIATEKPDYWEFKLLEELVRDRMVSVNTLFNNIQRGVEFRKKKYLKAKQFMLFCQVESRNLTDSMPALIQIVDNDIPKAIGPPGVPGDALFILETVNKMFKLLSNFLEWELEVRSVSVPEQFQEVASLFQNASEDIFKEMNLFPGMLQNIYTRPTERHELTLNFTTKLNGERISEILDYYTSNIHLLDAEDIE